MPDNETLRNWLLAAGVTIALVQATIAIYVFWSNNKRRKQEATIHYMNNIRDVYRKQFAELAVAIEAYSGIEAGAEALVNDRQLHERIAYTLGVFEHLAVGVHADVFDFELVARMSGAYLTRVYNTFRFYIDYRRASAKYPLFYSEFEELVNKLAARRKKKGLPGALPITYPPKSSDAEPQK